MPYKLTFTPRFEKNYKKLTRAEKQQVKGTDHLFECSVHMDITTF